MVTTRVIEFSVELLLWCILEMIFVSRERLITRVIELTVELLLLCIFGVK